MSKFYFTYGMSGYPFAGGWTEIEATDKRQACQIFRIVHPDRTKGLLNCSDIYTEAQFAASDMSGNDGNFGKYCQEKISLQRKIIPETTRPKVCGLVITPAGQMLVKFFKKPLYKSVGREVGGLIEHVLPKGLKSPYCMLVNEEGLLKDLPLNLIGSLLYQTPIHGNVVVGNIIIMKDGIVDGEPDIIGLDDDDIIKVQQNIIRNILAWEWGLNDVG